MSDIEFYTSMNYFGSLIENYAAPNVKEIQALDWFDYCVTPQKLDDYSIIPNEVTREILNYAFGTYMDFNTLPEGQVQRSRYDKIVEYIQRRKKCMVQSFIPRYIIPMERSVNRFRIQHLKYCIGYCYAIEGVQMPAILQQMERLDMSSTLKTIVRREYAMIQTEFPPETILTMKDYKYIDKKHEAKLKAIKDKLATFI